MKAQPTAIFRCFDPAGRGWLGVFSDPCDIRMAHHLDDIAKILRFAEDASFHGRWVVLAVAYEAAPAFDPALVVHDNPGHPLIWAASFAGPDEREPSAPQDRWACSEWTPALSRSDYSKGIEHIHDFIARGETYQVNYTFPLKASFTGHPLEGLQRIGPAQGAGYSAWLDLGSLQLLSFSPELFFERKGRHINVRPMKGTMARGRFPIEDEAFSRALAESRKDRAENVMIVDMLRNDLGRIAIPGSIRVDRLFEVERYRTLLQMTSTVTAELPPDTGLGQVFAALFPSASITGAPKVRTMHIIRELEPFARGFYTGAIGLVKPGGDAVFNVAIRTVTANLQTREAVCNVGGGITWDSTDAGEYEECRLKAAFLTAPAPDFDLFETLLLEEAQFLLPEGHMARLCASVRYFDFSFPESEIRTALNAIRGQHPRGRWRVRLLLSMHGAVRTEVKTAPPDRVFQLAVASLPVDSTDRFLFHKTTLRGIYGRARAEHPDADDVLLFNERGELTESTLANVVVEREGRRFTPPPACGLLPGVFREDLLRTGALSERILYRADLQTAQALYLVNSVRKWIPARLM